MNNSVEDQLRMCYNAMSRISKTYQALMDLINDPKNPLRSNDIYKLIERKPERYSMFKFVADDLAKKEKAKSN